jgi:hypothetical protein
MVSVISANGQPGFILLFFTYSSSPQFVSWDPSGALILTPDGSVEKSRQRRSHHFSVLTYQVYAPRVKMAVALLDGLF